MLRWPAPCGIEGPGFDPPCKCLQNWQRQALFILLWVTARVRGASQAVGGATDGSGRRIDGGCLATVGQSPLCTWDTSDEARPGLLLTTQPHSAPPTRPPWTPPPL